MTSEMDAAALGVGTIACETCRFYHDYGGKEGDCRRHAPRAFLRDREDQSADAVRAYWPEVLETMWCGEWQRARTW